MGDLLSLPRDLVLRKLAQESDRRLAQAVAAADRNFRTHYREPPAVRIRALTASFMVAGRTVNVGEVVTVPADVAISLCDVCAAAVRV